ncbi:hypothetical protein EV182_004647 [Spiromyces aspiralis]|uniref:Uncharacterized protein n=1 Tax=Spiromyces aspiralis TaxID=68401 RepID=A0ACC1HHE6_9FUNG|nr:hypothetical protein EV182_004647 [Spiromyces aspiralis]
MLGGPIAAVFAAKCQHLDITVVDRDKQRIRQWNALEPPIHEPEIREILERHLGRNLRFTTDFDQAIARADMIFIAVNTPPKPVSSGSPYQDIDTSFVEQCVYDILSATRNTSGHKTIVQKSTVPCRTAQRIREIIDSSGVSLGAVRFDVLSNPEFLSEGTSIHNLSHPDRVLIGCDKTSSGLKAQEALAQLYANWVPKEKIITTDLWSSELAKLASNAMLAQRISTINSLSAVCEKLGSDVVDIAKACGADRRIGASYLNASIGFGGSCLEKDIMSLIWLCHGLDLPEVAEYWTQVLNINSYQGRRCTQMVADVLGGCISDKKLACLGYSFKKNTGDVRNSPAIAICGRLVEWGASLAIYDPMADPNEVMASLARYGSASGE